MGAVACVLFGCRHVVARLTPLELMDRLAQLLRHVGEPTEPPAILPARSPPQTELAFGQDGGRDDWPEMEQSVDTPGDPWD